MDNSTKERLYEIIGILGSHSDFHNDREDLAHFRGLITNSLDTKLLIIIIKLLLNDRFGLKEIKKEVKDIEDNLDDAKHSFKFALKEVRKDLKDIAEKLDDPKFGLKEIKMEIKDIEEKLDDPKFGLMEIKKEIKKIEEKLDDRKWEKKWD